MSQTVPFNLYLGPAKTGVALGAIVYEADGTTVYASFSTSGWYEEPDGTGDWHHPGVTFPDAGGVLAYGVSGTEYRRYSVDAAPTTAIFDYAVESGHTLQTVLRALYALVRGNSVANDSNDPTEIIYYAPDGSTVRVTHTLTTTTRTAS